MSLHYKLQDYLVLNSYFQAAENWRLEDIHDRAEQLVEQVLSCWPYFGDASANHADADNIVGAKPESVTVLDQTCTVKTWREVLQCTLQVLAEQAPDTFAQLTEHYPHYIAKSPQGFRAPKELNGGYYIETNLGALSINRFCRRAVETLGLPPTAWSVTVTAATND